MTAQRGLAPDTDNTTTWADRTVQEAFALSCVLLKHSFPVSSQHRKLSTSEEARSQNSLQQSTGNAAAPWHSLDMPRLLRSLEAGANIKCILPPKSLTACAAKPNAGLQQQQQTQEFPLCLPRCQSQKGFQKWSGHFPGGASLFDWGGGSREETQTFSTGRWAHALKA